MADKTVSLEMLINAANAAQTVGEMRTALRDIRNEMAAVGDDSAEFNRLASAAANVRDRIGDINSRIEAFNPDNKFAAFNKVAQGLGAGIQAATGAMALFGDQSEDVQQALLKVQGAMAFGQAIGQLGELQDAFKTLWAVIVANPIAAAVAAFIALGAIVVKLTYENEAMTKAQEDVTRAMDGTIIKDKALRDSYNDSLLKLREVENQYKVLAGTMTEFEASLDAIEARYTQAITEIHKETQVKLAEVDGFWNQTWEFVKSGGNAAVSNINLAKDKAEILAEEQEKINVENTKKRADEEKLRLEKEKKEIDAAKKSADERLKAKKEADEAFLKAETELREKMRLIREQAEKDQIEATEKNLAATLQRIEAAFNRPEFADSFANSFRTKITEAVASLPDEVQKAFKNAEGNVDFTLSNFELRIAVFMAKVQKMNQSLGAQVLSQTGNLFGALSELSKKNSAAQKAFAVAQSLINTYQGVTKALATFPPPANFIAAAATAASGFAAIRNILAVNEQGSGSGAAASGGGSGGGLSSASFEAFGGGSGAPQPSTLLNPDGSVQQTGTQTQQGNPQFTVTAVVVETEMTSVQQQVHNYQQASMHR